MAYIPSLIWLWSSLHGWVFGIAAVIAVPHLIQDDGRLLARYSMTVKKADITRNLSLSAALDQSFHLIALFLTALLASK
jgi:hypothetical protein